MGYFRKDAETFKSLGKDGHSYLQEICTIARLEALPELFNIQLIGCAFEPEGKSIKRLDLFYFTSSPNHFNDIEDILSKKWIAQNDINTSLCANSFGAYKEIEMSYYYGSLHIHLNVTTGYRRKTHKNATRTEKIIDALKHGAHILTYKFRTATE